MPILLSSEEMVTIFVIVFFIVIIVIGIVNAQKRKNPNKTTSNNNLVIIIIIAGVILGGIWASNNLVFNTNSNNDSVIPQIESKELKRSDFEMKLESGSWTSVYVNITPNREIKDITLLVEYFDKNGSIVKTEEKTFYNLSKNQTYKYEFKNSFTEILKMDSYRATMVSGTRK